MTIEQRAACIADLAMPGAVRCALRRKRVYDKALQMLGELAHERGIKYELTGPSAPLQSMTDAALHALTENRK
jgi:hypothetical protein